MEMPGKDDELNLKRVHRYLSAKLRHFKSLKTLGIEALCKNLALFTSRDYARRFFHPNLLPDAIWNQLLPSFVNDHRLQHFYKDKPSEYVEVLLLLMEMAVHFDFKCASNLLETPYEEMLWDALPRKAPGLRSLVSLHTAFPVRISERLFKDNGKPGAVKLLSSIPGRLEKIGGLRSLQSLHLSFGHVVDNLTLASFAENLPNLVSLKCCMAKKPAITTEALDQFFSKLKHLKQFRCNTDFVHLKSLLEMNHKLEVAGLEASLKFLPTISFLNPAEPGHSANGLQNPIPLKHLVLKREGLDKDQVKMLPCVQNLMLDGWDAKTEVNDAVWRTALDLENLQSLHFIRSNTVYLEFLEKFGPELKELSLVCSTDYNDKVVPLGRILKMCPKLETLFLAQGNDAIIEVGPLPLPPMEHLKKITIEGKFSMISCGVGTLPMDLTDDLLIHLLSSPELRECKMDDVKFTKKAAVKLEILARSGKIFQNLEYCQIDSGEGFSKKQAAAYLRAALSHAPNFKGPLPAHAVYDYYSY